MVIFCMVNQIMRIFRKSTTQCMSRKNWCNTRCSKRKSLQWVRLGLRSLNKRRKCSKLIFFYKIVNGLLPEYLYSCLDFSSEENYHLRSAASSKLKLFSSKTKSFKKYIFFPDCVNEWNNLKTDARNAKSLNVLYFQFIIHSASLRKKYTYSELFWSAFFPHFLTFGLNTEKYRHSDWISLRIQSECGKMREKCAPE